MALVVMKFGGTSVANGERIRQVAEIVAAARKKDAVVVVVSALAGVTDSIVALLHAARRGDKAAVERHCDELQRKHHTILQQLFGATRRESIASGVEASLARLKEIAGGLLQLRSSTPQVADMALSLGEEISAQICAAYLDELGTPADYVDAARVVVTDEHYGEATPELEATRRASLAVLLPLVNAGRVPVVTGYRGATPAGHLTTLGRGGSDYSATLIGAALRADEVWIWTDVNGVLTADPRICPGARTLPEVTFAEAIELSHYGAKVIHQRAVRPCMEAGIPVWIKNTLQPADPGTKITDQCSERVSPVRAVTSLVPAAMITLVTRPDVHFADVLGRLYLRLAHDHVDVPFLTQSSSENALGLALREQDLERVLHQIQRLFRTELKHGVLLQPRVERELAVVAVLGQQMKGVPGVLARIFGAVARCGVSVIAVAQGASEMNVCFAVPAAHAARVVAAVHDEFLAPEAIAAKHAAQQEAALPS